MSKPQVLWLLETAIFLEYIGAGNAEAHVALNPMAGNILDEGGKVSFA